MQHNSVSELVVYLSWEYLSSPDPDLGLSLYFGALELKAKG